MWNSIALTFWENNLRTWPCTGQGQAIYTYIYTIFSFVFCFFRFSSPFDQIEMNGIRITIAFCENCMYVGYVLLPVCVLWMVCVIVSVSTYHNQLAILCPLKIKIWYKQTLVVHSAYNTAYLSIKIYDAKISTNWNGLHSHVFVYICMYMLLPLGFRNVAKHIYSERIQTQTHSTQTHKHIWI